MIGSDMDGVLCWSSLDKALFRPYKLHQYYAKCSATGYAQRFWTYIITGRKECFRKVTEKWLDEHGVYYGQLIMFPIGEKKTNKTLARYKSYKILDLGINVFFEDDEKIVEYLQQNCPNVNIIKVKYL